MSSGLASAAAFRSTSVGRIAEVRLGKMLQPKQNAPTDSEVHYLRAGSLEGLTEDGPLRKMWASPMERANYGVQQGDLILAEGGDVGRSAFVPEVPDDTIIQNSLHRVRPRDGDVRFIKYALDAVYASGWLDVLCNKSTFGHLTHEKLTSLNIPWPTLHQQRAIADYLDAEIARIDALIEKKRKQSALIDDRWVALVTDLVRGRRAASSHLTESGVDWIGALPEEWGTPSVGMMFDVELGKMLNQRATEGENQRRYLRNQNVQWDSFDLGDVSTMHFETDESARYGVRKGDLLVCEGGDVGRAAMWSSDEDIYYQKALHRVRPRTSAPPRFLMYVLWAASALEVFATEGNQSTIVHLTREQLRAHRIPWPPEEEQHRIVSELDGAKAQMRDLQEKWSRQLELLTEHRQALITAAVTGQVEVPGDAVS